MRAFQLFALVGASALVLATTAEPTAAQVILGRGRGLIVNAPGAFLRIGPIGGYGVYGGPLRGMAVAPNGAGPYPGYASPNYANNPNYAGSPNRRLSARPFLPRNSSANSAPLPSQADWRRMADSELLNRVVQTAGRLEQELGGFTTAESWRNYLRLPDDALSPADGNQRVRLRLASVAETLQRFESAGGDPTYRQITSLPSYGAMQDALGEIVRRFGADAASAPSAQTTNQAVERQHVLQTPPATNAQQAYSTAKPAVHEELPAPPPVVRKSPDDSAGNTGPSLLGPRNAEPEHSVLRK